MRNLKPVALGREQKHKRIFRALVHLVGLSVSIMLWTVNYSPPVSEIRALPEVLHISVDTPPMQAAERFVQGGPWTAEASLSGDERYEETAVSQSECTFRLFGIFPLRTVTVVSTQEHLLVPGGAAVGISIKTQGVLVVGLGQVQTASGVMSPGAAAGLNAGDRIVSVNGAEIKDAFHLASLCKSGGEGMQLTVDREGVQFQFTAYPAVDLEGKPRLGVWVRDSTAGVGTLSFYDPESGWFAALGHAVSDVDTHALLTVREGKLIASSIVDIIPGAEGEPGELTGVFSFYDQAVGTVRVNSELGIFGTMEEPYGSELADAIPMAYASEVQIGPATLLATVSDEGVQAFACEIVRLSPQTEPAPKGMVVVVTDERLLKSTGGIVQGMSGSPVVQNGKLAGAVTHVFVNDPTRGYGVFAEWMLTCIP